MKHARTKATDITREVKEAVFERDGILCIICGKRVGMPNAHYIPRSQGGLGIEQNIGSLCEECHNAYDNGHGRELIGRRFREYLKSKYPEWNEEMCVYNRWPKELDVLRRLK